MLEVLSYITVGVLIASGSLSVLGGVCCWVIGCLKEKALLDPIEGVLAAMDDSKAPAADAFTVVFVAGAMTFCILAGLGVLVATGMWIAKSFFTVFGG